MTLFNNAVHNRHTLIKQKRVGIEAYEGQYQYPEVKTWLKERGFTAIARYFADQPDWFFGNVLFKKTS